MLYRIKFNCNQPSWVRLVSETSCIVQVTLTKTSSPGAKKKQTLTQQSACIYNYCTSTNQSDKVSLLNSSIPTNSSYLQVRLCHSLPLSPTFSFFFSFFQSFPLFRNKMINAHSEMKGQRVTWTKGSLRHHKPATGRDYSIIPATPFVVIGKYVSS